MGKLSSVNFFVHFDDEMSWRQSNEAIKSVISDDKTQRSVTVDILWLV